MITVIVMSALIAIAIIYDVYAYRTPGRITISWLIHTTTREKKWGWMIPLAMGILIGHFFWPL